MGKSLNTLLTGIWTKELSSTLCMGTMQNWQGVEPYHYCYITTHSVDEGLPNGPEEEKAVINYLINLAKGITFL